MKYCSFLRSLALLVVTVLPACSAFPGPRTPALVGLPTDSNTPSPSNPARPTEENQPLTTPTPVEATDQFFPDATIEPGSILYGKNKPATPTPAGESILFLPNCQFKPGSTTSGISPSQAYPGWDRYVDAEYGFSFSFPSDWILVEGDNYVCLFPQAAQEMILVVGFKRATETVPIHRSGVGEGDLIPRGTVRFLGQTLTRDVLVYQGKNKAVLYNNAMETQIDDLVFTLSMDDFRTDYFSAILPADIQRTADKIIESFELVNS
jgi:hypothetical protein